MLIEIGRRLATLRNERGISEDTLAKFIGVGCKDIIKWESGKEYPPLEIIPVLAGYFSVTADELIGTDKLSLENKRRQYLEQFHEMIGKGNSAGGADIMREALIHFPDDYRLKYMLMYSLYISCNRPAAIKHLSGEVISLGEGILSGCSDDGIRTETRRLLAMHYLVDLKDSGKAVEYASGFPSCRSSKEAVMPEVANGDEKLTAYQSAIIEFSALLISALKNYTEENKELTATQKIEYYEAARSIRHMIYPKNDFFGYEYEQMQLMQKLAELYANAGNEKASLDCLREAAVCASAYDALPKTLPHISPLVSRLAYTRPKSPENDTGRSCRDIFLNDIIPMPCFEPFRYNPEIKDICDILK